MRTAVSRRQYLAGVASGALAGLAGCSSGDGASGSNNGIQSRTIQVALTFNQDHTQAEMIKRFRDNVDEQTDGQITVDPLFGGSIGGEEEQMEAGASGSVDMHGTALGGLTQAYGPEYGFAEAPFVAESWEHYQAIADEYIFADGGFNDQLIEEGNQRILQGALRGLRGFTSNFPVRHPDDVQDVKLRLAQFDMLIEIWNGVGANATPVSFDELYSALETGVVDASEGPIQQFMDASLYEVQSHFSTTNHLLQTNQYVINEDTWQDMSGEAQTAVEESLSDAIEWANEQTRSETDELLQTVQEEHDVTVVTDVDREAFREAARPTLERLFEEQWTANLDDVKSLA